MAKKKMHTPPYALFMAQAESSGEPAIPEHWSREEGGGSQLFRF